MESNRKVGAVSVTNMGISQLNKNVQETTMRTKMTKRTQKNQTMEKRKRNLLVKNVFIVKDTGIEFLNVRSMIRK